MPAPRLGFFYDFRLFGRLMKAGEMEWLIGFRLYRKPLALLCFRQRYSPIKCFFAGYCFIGTFYVC